MKPSHRPVSKLTDNQSLVLGELREASEPMTAYGLLDRLRDRGIKAPAQVYRALDRLTALGLTHRLESRSAYLPCRQNCAGHGGTAVFALCERCGAADELDAMPFEAALGSAERSIGFTRRSASIELVGFCRDCSDASAGAN